MGNNGIASVHDGGVIPSLIEHTHIHTQDICQIDGTAGAACVRADDHQMIAVYQQIRLCLEKALDKLVRGRHSLETMERDRVLHPWIMSFKGNDVVHAHAGQLLKGKSAVQGFPASPSVLAAFIEEGHDHIDPACLSAHCRDDPFQILKMVVGRHVVHLSAQGIGKGIIANIHHQVQVISADRFFQNALGFSGTKTGRICPDQIGVPFVTLKFQVVLLLMIPVPAPFHNIIVDFIPQLRTA